MTPPSLQLPPLQLPSFRLDGRHALVTGASSGLGRHFAGTLAAAGARVTVTARRRDALDQTVAAVRAAGGEARAVVMDVTDAASVASAFDEAERSFGPVTALVNNAGVAAARPALDVPDDEWDAVLGTNLTGVFRVAREAAARMRRQDGGEDGGGGGAIVNVASILGLRVAGGLAAYAASKAGVVQLTRALALEWARHGVRVNALAPGYVRTDMNDAFFASEAGRAMVRRVPQRRLGEAAELDGPLLLLLSDAGSFMTGSVVAADGGHLVSGL